jgi:hypothetical protein
MASRWRNEPNYRGETARGGHYRGYVRDLFLDAVEPFAYWDGNAPKPMIERDDYDGTATTATALLEAVRTAVRHET